MNNSAIKISLVTPTLNSEEFLQEALDSISIQRGAFELEHILVDGGSSDKTPDIVEAYANDRCHWISEQDGGMYDALAKGFAKSSGEIMGWINSDDVYFPGALDMVARIFTDLPEVEWISTLSPVAIDPAGDMFKIRKIAGFSRDAFADGIYVGFDGFDNPYASDFIQQESTFWRRSLWERLGPDPLAYYRQDRRQAGDFGLWAKFIVEAKLYGIEAPLCAWRMSPGQWTDPDIYMSEVKIALEGLRDKIDHKSHAFDGEFASYTGNYIAKENRDDSGSAWKSNIGEFYVMPKSDIKKAVTLNRLM